jgi:hypothetical protein
MFLYSVDLAATVAKRLFGLDLLADLPQATALLQRLGDKPHVRALADESTAATPASSRRLRKIRQKLKNFTGFPCDAPANQGWPACRVCAMALRWRAAVRK